MNYELNLLNHIEDCVVEHIEIVSINAFCYKGFAIVIFDLLCTMYLHENEDGI